MPGTMLTKKIQRQPSASVSQPPIVGPSVGASIETTPRIAGIIARCGPSKKAKPVANTSRDHRPADEALDGPEDDHRLEVPGRAANALVSGEQAGRDGEQPARRQRLGQEGRERDHHDLGHQIGGLDPVDLVGAGREARLDVVHRGDDDLDVEQGHELAERHHQEDQDTCARSGRPVGPVAGVAAAAPMDMLPASIVASLT